MLIGECPKCDALFDGRGLSNESKAQIVDGTHPGTLCPACKEKGYAVVGVVRFRYEADGVKP